MRSISHALVAAALAVQAGSQVQAQQNGYGGYDIAGAAGAEEAFYGEARGWKVFSSRVSGGFASCFAATQLTAESELRLGWDKLQWQLAVPLNMQTDWEGTLQIDGQGSGQGYGRGGDNISGTSTSGWTIAWLGEAELDGMRQGNSAVLGVGKFDIQFSLAGATAAILKVQECVERAGGAALPATEPAGEAAMQTGSLFRNVMHGCYLSTNDNGEVSCDVEATAGSRWELSPADDGKYSSLYNLTHSCALAMGRDSAGSDQLSCYFNGDEQQAAFEFSLAPFGDGFNLVNARRNCGVYGNTTDIVTCLSLEASSDQVWQMVN